METSYPNNDDSRPLMFRHFVRFQDPQYHRFNKYYDLAKLKCDRRLHWTKPTGAASAGAGEQVPGAAAAGGGTGTGAGVGASSSGTADASAHVATHTNR